MRTRFQWMVGFSFIVYGIFLLLCWHTKWANITRSSPNRKAQADDGLPVREMHDTPAMFDDDFTSSKSNFTKTAINARPLKLIMVYNPFKPSLTRPDTSAYVFTGCEYNECALALDPAQSDLLVINGGSTEGLIMPPRPAGQIWLLNTREPPTSRRFRFLQSPQIVHQINWTRTIFNDSTFPARYGFLAPRRLPADKDYERIYYGKKYDVAWFVSNCKASSQREEYVSRMMSHIDVHIYGECGNRTCGSYGYRMGGKKAECLGLLSRKYKFYLSFENSFCRDYVTEKFFGLFPDTDVIPVVRGGADYKRLLPQGVMINSNDFRTPEDLGKYLYNLARDKVKYITMLKEKNRYKNDHQKPPYYCQLCKALHLRQPVNTYENIYDWLLRPGNCWQARDL